MIIKHEMTITHADFFRLLPLALADCPFDIDQHKILARMPAGTVTIRLGPETVRKIGSLVLDVTQVTFCFEGVTSAAIESFLKNFNHAYHKGGG